MANPLKELDLSVYGFQFIQEIPIAVPPAKAWKSLVNVDSWFSMRPDAAVKITNTLELHPGGRWFSKSADGNETFHATVTHIEPGKLLRVSGQFGLTHLPCTTVIIFELQPKDDGKSTLLRLGQRTYGFLDADVQQRFTGGWGTFLPLLKKAAEAPDAYNRQNTNIHSLTMKEQP